MPVVPLPPAGETAGGAAACLLPAVLTHTYTAPLTHTHAPTIPPQVGQQAAQQLASSLLCSQWRYQAALRAAAAAGGLGGAAKGAAAAWGKTAVLEVGGDRECRGSWGSRGNKKHGAAKAGRGVVPDGGARGGTAGRGCRGSRRA